MPKSIDNMQETLLVRILELLPFIDRLNVELVCKQWQYLARYKGWSHFTRFSAREFELDTGAEQEANAAAAVAVSPTVHRYGERFSRIVYDWQKRSVSIEEFQSLFRRCGPFLRELDFRTFQVYESICFSVLPMAPHLQHLHMDELVRESAGLLASMADWMRDLRSVVFINLHYQLSDALLTFLRKCGHLEYLQLSQCAAGDFSFLGHSTVELPASLRYLRLDATVNATQILAKATEQCEQLEALWLESHALCIDAKLAGRLRYLRVQVDTSKGQHEEFRQLLPSLSNLRALDIWLVDEEGHFFDDGVGTSLFDPLATLQTLRLISKRCKHLRHLSIDGAPSAYRPLSYEGLSHLHSLEKLCSLTLRNADCDGEEMGEFFERFSTSGTLEFFDTDGQLPVEYVCASLQKNARLSYVGMASLSKRDHGKLLSTLGQLNAAAEAPQRRLRVAVKPSIANYDFPASKWLKVKDHGHVSEQRERTRLGVLSSVPSFLRETAPEKVQLPIKG